MVCSTLVGLNRRCGVRTITTLCGGRQATASSAVVPRLKRRLFPEPGLVCPAIAAPKLNGRAIRDTRSVRVQTFAVHAPNLAVVQIELPSLIRRPALTGPEDEPVAISAEAARSVKAK